MSLLVMILVGIFFVSGADAASIVMGTLSQKGAFEPGRSWSSSGAWSPVPSRPSCCSSATARATRSPDCRT